MANPLCHSSDTIRVFPVKPTLGPSKPTNPNFMKNHKRQSRSSWKCLEGGKKITLTFLRTRNINLLIYWHLLHMSTKTVTVIRMLLINHIHVNLSMFFFFFTVKYSDFFPMMYKALIFKLCLYCFIYNNESIF